MLVRKTFSSGLSCECPLPYSEVQPICLLRKSSDTTRKFSRPALGTVRSAQTWIWPYSSLYLLPKSTIAPKVHSLKQLGEFHPNWGNLLWFHKQISFLFSHTTPGVLHFGFGPAYVFRQSSGICFPPRQGEGERSGCLGLTCSVWPGRGRDTAVTVVMCGDCLKQQRPVGSCYSLRWVMQSPRGIGPGSWVPQ